MKLRHFVSFLAAIILAPDVLAQSGGGRYELKACVTAAGGATSSSVDQRFRLDATVGQPDAAPVLHAARGRFTVEPGFWHHAAVVQTPGAPVLQIRPGRAGTVILSWPLNTTGFVLEESATLAPDTWSKTAAPVVDTASDHVVIVRLTGDVRIFRLRKD